MIVVHKSVPFLQRATTPSSSRRGSLRVRNARPHEEEASKRSKKRRRGRPAHLRSPYDSPLRDGNRDRLMGLLTKRWHHPLGKMALVCLCRSAATLTYYLMETNVNLHHWLLGYIKRNPIPQQGAWEDVSGDTFLRNLLSMKVVSTKWSEMRDPMFDCVEGCAVDPRNIAQRIMTIRTELAGEFIQELQNVNEENNLLYRETLAQSLLSSSTEEN